MSNILFLSVAIGPTLFEPPIFSFLNSKTNISSALSHHKHKSAYICRVVNFSTSLFNTRSVLIQSLPRAVNADCGLMSRPSNVPSYATVAKYQRLSMLGSTSILEYFFVTFLRYISVIYCWARVCLFLLCNSVTVYLWRSWRLRFYS